MIGREGVRRARAAQPELQHEWDCYGRGLMDAAIIMLLPIFICLIIAFVN